MSQELLNSIIESRPQNHPECLEDEVFLTNVCPADIKDIGWETKRFGRVAYYMDGTLIKNIVPIFVKKQEILENI